jgi:hypothetical protein
MTVDNFVDAPAFTGQNRWSSRQVNPFRRRSQSVRHFIAFGNFRNKNVEWVQIEACLFENAHECVAGSLHIFFDGLIATL